MPGRIVNMSSASGKIAGPFMGAYCASKFGLEGLSESLRRELRLFGITVIIIGPGAVATPICKEIRGGRDQSLSKHALRGGFGEV